MKYSLAVAFTAALIGCSQLAPAHGRPDVSSTDVPTFQLRARVVTAGGRPPAGKKFTYRFDVPSQSWINTPGVLTSISVGLGAGSDASVWGINAASLIYVFDTQRQNWQNVPGTLSQLSVGFDGTVWGVNGGDLIYRYDPASSTSWDNVPGLLKQISVSSQSVVWGVNAAGAVYRYY